MVVISVSWKEFQKIDVFCKQDTHSQYTSVQYSLFTSAERTPRAWLKGRQGSSHHGLHFIFVRLKRICHLVLHMSHPYWLTHLPFTTSTSSSSFTPPSTTTPEHAAQLVQHDQLREHPIHHAHLQALPVDKLRHQESLWRENLQSGGNRARQLPQLMSPKGLRLYQGSKIILEIHNRYMMYRIEFGKQDHRVPITEEVKEFGEMGQLAYRILKYQRRPTSNRRCISTILWKALQILISKMESYKRC